MPQLRIENVVWPGAVIIDVYLHVPGYTEQLAVIVQLIVQIHEATYFSFFIIQLFFQGFLVYIPYFHRRV